MGLKSTKGSNCPQIMRTGWGGGRTPHSYRTEPHLWARPAEPPRLSHSPPQAPQEVTKGGHRVASRVSLGNNGLLHGYASPTQFLPRSKDGKEVPLREPCAGREGRQCPERLLERTLPPSSSEELMRWGNAAVSGVVPAVQGCRSTGLASARDSPSLLAQRAARAIATTSRPWSCSRQPSKCCSSRGRDTGNFWILSESWRGGGRKEE